MDGKSLKAEVIDEELVRLERLLTQLLDRRLNKIESQADLDQTTDLTPTEKQAYQSSSSTHRDFKRLKDEILKGNEPTTSMKDDRSPLLVRFVKDVPSIIGVDLRTHGPFQREDIAALPRENAQSLIRQGTAVEVRASSSG